MFKVRDSATSSKPLVLDRVNQLVQEALAGIRGAPPVNVVNHPSDIGLQPPPGSVGYGVTVRSGEIYVFQSAMDSDLDVFHTVFHELFYRGIRVVVPKDKYVQTIRDLARGDVRILQSAGTGCARRERFDRHFKRVAVLRNRFTHPSTYEGSLAGGPCPAN
jgi:hypothetical protein